MESEKMVVIWRSLCRNKLGLAGVIILTMLLLVTILAGPLSPYDPSKTVARPFLAPSSKHFLGTNDIGQDIFSELLHGSRTSLLIGVVAALVAISIGTVAGVISGYYGGHMDMFIMRLVDLVLVIPFLPLMILLAAFLGPSFRNLITVIGALTWARPARVIRSQTLTIKTRDYIEAARAIGAQNARILVRHVLPGVLPLSLAQFVLAASMSILIEASLSFLGLGDPTQKSWGTILYYAQARGAFLSGSWLWWVIPPGLMITLAVLGFAFTGFAMEEVLNPRLRK